MLKGPSQALVLCASFLAVPFAGAQAIDHTPPIVYAHQITKSPDSGYLGNQDLVARVVFSMVVTVPGANWTRLYLSNDTVLEGDSQIRITSLRDGDMQFLQSHTLRDYEFRSGYFNGNQLRVDLLASSMTQRNRVRLVAADQGGASLFGPLSQCGPTDDRKPSTDPRAGRQYPTGCTSWMIGIYAGLTAGHCTSSTAQTIMFNVPPSSSSGSLRFPPISDQYPYDRSTVRRLASGVGSDWAVFATVRNSNTGLYPGEKQGSWFKLTPPAVNATMRVTGYGTTNPRNSRNQTQQTHTGLLQRRASTSLCYHLDTSGGNSGSPVIDEKTGLAVGIHTHGGCRTSGSGCNSGTRIDRVDLQTAIKNLLAWRTVGTVTAYGTGCAGSAGVLKLERNNAPELGNAFKVSASGLPSSSAAGFMLGASKTNWGAVKLPFDMGLIGAKGCSLLTSIDVLLVFSTGNGKASPGFAIPNAKTFIGLRLFAQVLSIDPKANPAGLATSNGVEILVGGLN